MRGFKWIDWNRDKIAAHALSTTEVEAAFQLAFDTRARRDGSFETYGKTPSGRHVTIIWRYDLEDDEVPDIFGDPPEPATFVITAY